MGGEVGRQAPLAERVEAGEELGAGVGAETEGAAQQLSVERTVDGQRGGHLVCAARHRRELEQERLHTRIKTTIKPLHMHLRIVARMES